MNDKHLRDAIQALRLADESVAPTLEAVFSRRRQATSFDARRLAVTAVAATAVFAGLGLALRVAARPARLVVPREIVALSSWSPVTDALLTGPYATLPLDSVLDDHLSRTRRDSFPE